MRSVHQDKDIAIKIAQADGVSRASLITGISPRTIYYWLDQDATAKDKVRRRKAAEAAEAAIEEAAMLQAKLAECQEEIKGLLQVVEILEAQRNEAETQRDEARNTAQTLNDHIHNHYPFGKVLDLTGDTHA